MENNEKICSIICGAPCGLEKKFVTGLVIAADSGLDRCVSAGITPDIVVGDFDSASAEVPTGVEVVRAIPEKDDTDTALAARIATERGYNELRFFCAFGGRISHSLANIQLLRALCGKNISGAMFGEESVMFILNEKSVTLPKFDGYLSVFALSDTARVSESGVKYPVSYRDFFNDYPLGVSNEIIDDFATITVHSGMCAVVLDK